MTSYPKFDELITNLEESSNQLIDLIRVTETVKQLEQQQHKLLEGFAAGNQQLIQAASELQLTKNEVIKAVSVDFDRISEKNEKSIVTIEDAVFMGINSIQQEGIEFREGHTKLLIELKEQGDYLGQFNEINFEKLRNETAKVSQLEQQVVALIKLTEDKLNNALSAISQAVKDMDTGSMSIVKLTEISKDSGRSLKESLLEGLTSFSQKTDDILRKIQDELTGGRKQSAIDAKVIETVLVKSLQDGLLDFAKNSNDTLDTIKSSIEKSIQLVKGDISSGIVQLGDSCEEISTLVKQTRADNRQFYVDFEQLLRIKLDENKSEIKQLVEYERSQIREIVDHRMALVENRVQTYLEQRFDIIAKQQQKLQMTFWVVGGFVSTLAIYLVLKVAY